MFSDTLHKKGMPRTMLTQKKIGNFRAKSVIFWNTSCLHYDTKNAAKFIVFNQKLVVAGVFSTNNFSNKPPGLKSYLINALDFFIKSIYSM